MFSQPSTTFPVLQSNFVVGYFTAGIWISNTLFFIRLRERKKADFFPTTFSVAESQYFILEFNNSNIPSFCVSLPPCHAKREANFSSSSPLPPAVDCHPASQPATVFLFLRVVSLPASQPAMQIPLRPRTYG